jgi:hypothetical protein
MGTLYPAVGRVALFAGPNDGWGASKEEWATALYIEHIAGVTDTRYYGLIHQWNKAPTNDDGTIIKSVLYEVEEAWRKFGMAEPFNPAPFWFDPQPGVAPDFLGSHMLISLDPDTSSKEAHVSVVRGEYKDCGDAADCPIGYEPAWRYILGTGVASVSSTPFADAGSGLERRSAGQSDVIYPHPFSPRKDATMHLTVTALRR